jgi:hypothetical protein
MRRIYAGNARKVFANFCKVNSFVFGLRTPTLNIKEFFPVKMNIPFSFRPKLVDALKDYSAQTFYADLTAGFTVGIVALPLAMAFAIASGVKPAGRHLSPPSLPGFIISALGGSKVNIGGPTGAFIVILYGIGAKYGLENLAICTVIAGVILFIMGLARLGHDDQIHSVSGDDGIYVRHRRADFQHADQRLLLGLQMDKVPSDFVEKNGGFGHAPQHHAMPTTLHAGGSIPGHHPFLAQEMAAARTRLHCRTGVWARWRRLYCQLARGNYRQQIRRHSADAFRMPQISRPLPGHNMQASLFDPATDHRAVRGH